MNGDILRNFIKKIIPPLALERYSQYKVDQRYSINIVDPDFFVVSPHGAGMQSFLYYINLIGLPSSSWWDPSYLPMKKNERRGFGVTCDRVFSKIFPCPKKERNIFWIIRDPVLILRSVINQILGDAISSGKFKKNTRNISIHLDKILYGRRYNHYHMFSSQLKSVPLDGHIHAIDTMDISSENIAETIKHICNMYGIEVNDRCIQLMNIPYNNFENRMFSKFQEFIIDSDYSSKLRVCPSKLYDFHFNQWVENYTILELQINNQLYTIFSDRKQEYYKINKNNINLIKEKILLYEDYIDRCRELYIREEVKEYELISFIINNKKYHDKIMYTLQNEIKLVEKIAPEKIEKWHGYLSLLP